MKRNRILDGLVETLEGLELSFDDSLQFRPLARRTKIEGDDSYSSVDVVYDGSFHSLVLKVLPEIVRSTTEREVDSLKSAVSAFSNDCVRAYGVVVSPQISVPVMEQLKRAGLGYISLSGDIYLKFGGILISWKHNSTPYRLAQTVSEALRGKAANVVLPLLDKENTGKEWRLVELAKAAMIGAAVSHKAKLSLVQLGVLEPTRGKRFRLSQNGRQMLTEFLESQGGRS